MKWLVAAMALLLLFAYAVFCTNIYVNLRYKRRGDNDNIFVRVYAWRGLLSYVVKVPVVQMDWRDEMLWFESELKETKGNRRFNTVFERHVIKKVVDFICYHPRHFRRIVGRIQQKIQQARTVIRGLHDKVRCDRLNCQIRFGMEDAAATAVAAGGFWMIRGLVVTALRSRMSFGACPVCTITPVFGKEVIVIDLECILRIRLGNIINALRKADNRGE